MSRLVNLERFAKVRALHDSTDHEGERAAARQYLDAVAAEGLPGAPVQGAATAGPSAQAAGEIYLEVQLYGQVGPFRVMRVVRSDVSLGLTHVVVVSRTEREPTFIAGFPDTEEGIGIADYVGPAVVQALALARGGAGAAGERA
ncbi:hypothetical protein [Methylobacterium planeticum]|uniref:Uncharacterized protein n=1 Tax=Methylobacterium planeticum TaxID=2615211 RepID=A0A6N6MWM8_9HYPH|nr:hypothetical protein [Methylobacterium planeticum]KAB1075096.1 hypothetical protein F6X51_04190 [Methylobacterium planeticum]